MITTCAIVTPNNRQHSVFTVEIEEHTPVWKRALQFFCGMSDDVASEKKTAEEQAEHLRDITSLKQDRVAKLFLRANLIIILAVAVFMYIFFSVPDGGPISPTIQFHKNVTQNLSV